MPSAKYPGPFGKSVRLTLNRDMPLVTEEPCKHCGKSPRGDHFGYCLDCSDTFGISELFPDEERQKNLERLQRQRPPSAVEKLINLQRMKKYLAKRFGKE